MGYTIGGVSMKLARDFVGRRCRLLRLMTTKGGTEFDEGALMEVVKVWKGRLDLRHIDYGTRITGVSGYDVQFLLQPRPAPAKGEVPDGG